MDNNKVVGTMKYKDLIGREFLSEKDAQLSNHDISLIVRKYIDDELLITFQDSRLDRMGTTNKLWVNLDFTSECIENIYNIMMRKL